MPIIKINQEPKAQKHRFFFSKSKKMGIHKHNCTHSINRLIVLNEYTGKWMNEWINKWNFKEKKKGAVVDLVVHRTVTEAKSLLYTENPAFSLPLPTAGLTQTALTVCSCHSAGNHLRPRRVSAFNGQCKTSSRGNRRNEPAELWLDYKGHQRTFQVWTDN